VAPEQVLTTRGADEAIELLIETFATPYESAICITNPTFGSYVSFANLNGIKVIDVPLCKDSYLPDWKKLKTIDANIFFFCSPSNPIGNIIPITDIKAFAKSKSQKSLIIVDEAYIEFSDATSCISLLNDCENVIILRTLSKAYALAGLRIGITISSKEIINALRIILAPHPVPIPSIQIAIKALGTLGMSYYKDKIQLIKEQRDYLTKVFEKAKFVKHVYPSQTNFILVAVDDPD
jgi:histidinol-phosphate aminotransferase